MQEFFVELPLSINMEAVLDENIVDANAHGSHADLNWHYRVGSAILRTNLPGSSYG